MGTPCWRKRWPAAPGAVSLSSARLLPANGNQSRVPFVPNGNFHGTVQLGYFNWDQTHGSVEATYALSGSGKFGGTTAFSWVPRGFVEFELAVVHWVRRSPRIMVFKWVHLVDLAAHEHLARRTDLQQVLSLQFPR